MSAEAKTVTPFVMYGQRRNLDLDLRPVNRDDEVPEPAEEEAAPKDQITPGSTEPPVPEKLQSDEDENQKSQTPSSSTSTAEDTQESFSVPSVPSPNNVKSDDDSTAPEDSGADETTQTEPTLITPTIPTQPTLPTIPKKK